ncbi:DUF2892 domain-containing protein [candidate division KSB1 bacterium]|nr:MAG: DUF2892 domain-containing protein [candidate division KSB1 bacterium]
MQCNVGKTDKTIRLIIGAVILLIGLVTKSWWGLIGLLPIMTAVFGYCGLYTLLKFDTLKKNAN